jgi:hypothetical protein
VVAGVLLVELEPDGDASGGRHADGLPASRPGRRPGTAGVESLAGVELLAGVEPLDEFEPGLAAGSPPTCRC